MELGFSQTSIELLHQLDVSGWPTPQVVEIAKTYGFAVELMSTAFRPSGKHFVHHLVGTAGILAWCEQPPHVVKAGLIHAVYEFGDFGLESDPRRVVRKRAGEDVEELVWKYHNLKWSYQVVKDLDSGARALSSIDREVVIMRLANHLEDHLDQGMLYYPSGGSREGRRPALADALVKVARAVGVDELAQALDAVFEEDARAEIPDILRSEHGRVWFQARLDTMPRPAIVLRRAPSKLVLPVVRWAKSRLYRVITKLRG